MASDGRQLAGIFAVRSRGARLVHRMHRSMAMKLSLRSLAASIMISGVCFAACSGPPPIGGGNSSSPGSSGFGGSSFDSTGTSAGCGTSISGTVYDPAGKNPLYNVVVYVPKSEPAALVLGASCDACSSLYTGDPIATALTDTSGHFSLTNVPDGADVPLVIQIGKWRKQVKIPSVAKCTDNPQPDKSLRLPKNHAEGDIPRIAVSTGDADALECLLARIGVDASEYVGGADGDGRIHIFQGGSPTAALDVLNGGDIGPAPNTLLPGPSSAASLWDTRADLMQFDVVLLSCEGTDTYGMQQQMLFDYAAAGGRVFASHFHYAWFNTGPFGSANLATWSTSDGYIGDISANIVTTFPKGQALAKWLGTVGALQGGQLPITYACHNADVSAANAASQAWISADGGATEYLSFNTPIGAPAAKQCGRVVYSDLHVGAVSNDYGGDPTNGVVPSGCADQDLSPQEKALEFMLFDLSSCVTPDSQTPVPPPVH
jgi:hypothetical protein